MPISNEEILAKIERVLQSLEAQGLEHDFVASLRPILTTNLKKGRMQYFVEEEISRVDEYVQKVAELYKQLNPLLHDIQVERADDVWGPLFDKMQQWAYNLLIRKNFYSGQNTQDIAAECATEAAMIVLNAPFPYDTDLPPWLYTIVAHTCQKYMRKGMTRIERNTIELDEQLVVEDSPIDKLEYEMEMHPKLAVVLSKLSPARRQCIELSYFSELSPDEIAKKMNKSIGAIYSLRFHALDDLRTAMSHIKDDAYE